MAFKNNFSWSPDREELYNSCELCYILHYYEAHNGWLQSAPPEARAAYRWKKANKFDDVMFRTLVDALIDRVYTGETSLSATYTNIMQELNQAFVSSVNKKESWYSSPNKSPMLYELVYEDILDDSFVKKAQEELKTAIYHFKHSQLVKELSEEGSELKEVRQKYRGGYSYFEHEELGVRMYAGVEIVHQLNNGTTVATLFKTNETPSSLSQVRAVAQVVADTLHIPITDIVVRDEFLSTGTHINYPLTDKLLKQTDSAIRDSVGMMSEFLVDNDLERNEFVGFKHANYTRSRTHAQVGNNGCSMHECPYCEAVKRDLELYPKGYEANKTVLKYKGIT